MSRTKVSRSSKLELQHRKPPQGCCCAVPRTPYLQRLLPGGILDYLSVGHIYWPAGHESDLLLLLEGVLARIDAHVAIVLLDRVAGAGVSAGHREARGAEPAGRGSGGIRVAGFHGIAEEVIDVFVQRPLLISPLDPI